MWGLAFGVMAAEAHAARSCAARGASVVAKAGQARVFATSTGTVYFCRPGLRRRIGLYPLEDLDALHCPGWRVGVVALTPRYAAWARQRSCDDGLTWSVSVSRLARGARATTYPTGRGCQVNCPGGLPTGAVGRATRIALAPDGRLAWSAQDQFARNVFEISRVVDGQPRLLARATDVDPASVRWAGPLLVWQQAGVTRTG